MSGLQIPPTLRVLREALREIWFSSQPVLNVPLDFGGYCDVVDSRPIFESAAEKMERDLKRTRGSNIHVSR